MSYNIGQFRRTQRPAEDYMINYVKDVDYILNSSYPTTIDTYTFDDFAIQMTNSELDALHSFYLKYNVKTPVFGNTSLAQTITIKLKNDNSETVQTVKTNVNKGSGTVLITPIGTFKYIVFELERVTTDYTETNPSTGHHGRQMNIEITSFGLVRNILTDFINLQQPLTKIGVQGPKGLVMCINGEEIRVGNSGIYEIDNRMKINYFGVILAKDYTSMGMDDKWQYFILDYQYEVKGE